MGIISRLICGLDHPQTDSNLICGTLTPVSLAKEFIFFSICLLVRLSAGLLKNYCVHFHEREDGS